MRYFEDITIGEVQEAGPFELTESDIIERKFLLADHCLQKMPYFYS